MYTKRKRIGLKQGLLFLCVPVILLCAVGGVYAFITAKTVDVTNQFNPVKVTCQVEESFDGGVKENVRIRNTGDINAFIRAAIVISWVDSKGNVLSTAPVEGTDYAVEWGDTVWKKGSDGFWYHTVAVAPNGVTGLLIKQLTPITAPDGYQLQVQILAIALQADPPAAAENAWGVGVSGYTITPP